MIYKKINWDLIISICVVSVSLGVCATLLSFRGMPISEGWYSEYAWKINHGAVPYKDFEYLFPPLYLYIVAGFTRVFGYSIFALRILGVIVFVLIGDVLYLTLREIFDNLPAVIASIAALLFLQSENAQVFYDYIRFHDLFAFLAMLFLVLSSKQIIQGKVERKRKNELISKILAIGVFAICVIDVLLLLINYVKTKDKLTLFFMLFIGACLLVGMALSISHRKEYIIDINLAAILCGVFVSTECMIKQSNGVLMIIFVCMYFLFYMMRVNRDFLSAFINAFLGILVSFSGLLIYLCATNSYEQFMNCCVLNALKAKGGVSTGLFSWIFRELDVLKIEIYQPIIFTLIIIGLLFWNMRRKEHEGEGKYTGMFLLTCGGVFVVSILLFATSTNRAITSIVNYSILYLPEKVFFTCTIYFLMFGIFLLFCKIDQNILKLYKGLLCFPVLGTIFTQGYGCGMSGGLATSQTAIGLAFLIALLLKLLIMINNKYLVTMATFFVLAMSTSFFSTKAVQLYYWWGFEEGSLEDNNTESIVPMLSGIQMCQEKKKLYDTVYTDVLKYSDEEDDIFCFPNCPIFYTMTNRHSNTYTLVQWFDVSSADSINNDIKLLDNHHPQMIIIVNMPDNVYESHEMLFSTRQTRKMRESLNQIIVDSYEEIDTVEINDGYSVSVYNYLNK